MIKLLAHRHFKPIFFCILFILRHWTVMYRWFKITLRWSNSWFFKSTCGICHVLCYSFKPFTNMWEVWTSDFSGQLCWVYKWKLKYFQPGRLQGDVFYGLSWGCEKFLHEVWIFWLLWVTHLGVQIKKTKII